MFIASGTQMRWTGGQVSIPAGLDYNAVEIIRKAHGVEGSRDFWDRVTILESEVLTLTGEEAKKAMKKNGK